MKIYENEKKEIISYFALKMMCTYFQYILYHMESQGGYYLIDILRVRFSPIADFKAGFFYHLFFIFNFYVSCMIVGRIMNERMKTDKLSYLLRVGIARTGINNLKLSCILVIIGEIVQMVFLMVVLKLNQVSLIVSQEDIRYVLLEELVVILCIQLHISLANVIYHKVSLKSGNLILLIFIVLEELLANIGTNPLAFLPLSVMNINHLLPNIQNLGNKYIAILISLLIYNFIINGISHLIEESEDIL